MKSIVLPLCCLAVVAVLIGLAYWSIGDGPQTMFPWLPDWGQFVLAAFFYFNLVALFLMMRRWLVAATATLNARQSNE